MKGDLVLVRDFEGKLTEKRVHSATDEVVFVTSDNGLVQIEKGNLFPVGFRRECVYHHPGKLPKGEWGKLTMWKG